MIPYHVIEEIAATTLAQVKTAGYDIGKCVWEMSPSIFNTIRDHHISSGNFRHDPTGNNRESYMGVFIRRVDDEETGILLKQVNLNPHE